MGQNTSRHTLRVEASVALGGWRIDTIKLSYSRASCCGMVRRCTLAKLTFPHEGYELLGGKHECTARNGLSLPVNKLKDKDGETAVRIKCSYEGALLYTATLPLKRLLYIVTKSVEEGRALQFSLICDDDGIFRDLFCNGWRCRSNDCGMSYGQDEWHTEAIMESEQQQEQERWVHRSLHLAPRFRTRVAGPGQCFIEYMQIHFSVRISLDDPRKKLHIRGHQKDVQECNLYVRELLAKWRSDETS